MLGFQATYTVYAVAPRSMNATSPTKSIKVLLIEDNPTDVRLVQELLHGASSDHFAIIAASTLAQGLQRIASDHIDVILLDLGLPDSQGLDSFRAVEEHARDLPIIILTVSTDEELGRKIVLEGAQQFFSKDVLTSNGAYAEMFPRMIRQAIERKRTEAALMESERRYRSLAETANIIILRADLQLIITYCNDYTLQLLGYTAEELIGQPVVGTLLPATESTGRDLAQMARDILDHPKEYKHNRNEVTRKDGTRLWIEWTNAPQYDEVGNYTGVLSTGIDITERERARHTSSLNTILHVINEAPDLPTLYERAVTTTLEQFRFESGVVATVSDTGNLVVEYARNHPPAFIEAINGLNVDENAHTRVLYQQRELVVWDESPPETANRFHLSSRGAAIGIPFPSEGDVAGHVSLHAADPRSFTLEERELFQAIGLEFGTAVAKLQAKARAEEHAHRTAVLSEVIHVLNEASDLPTLYDRAVTTIIEQLHFADGMIVGVLDDGYLDVQYARPNTPPHVIEGTRNAHKDSNRYLLATYQDHEVVTLDEPAPDSHSASLGLRGAIVTIPLLSEGQAIGHIYLRADHWSLSSEDRELFQAIGREFGTAVAKLRAKDQAQEYAAKLKEHTDRLEGLIGERTAQLAQSEEYFRTIFEESSIGQVHYSADGHPLRINHAAATFFGINDVSDIQHLTIYSSSRTNEEAKARLRAGHPVRYEHVYDFKDISERGSFQTTRSDVRYVDLYMLPIFSTSGDSVEGYLAQLVDVTERKLAEDALQDAQRLAAIGQTATMIGHDLRNPLQALQLTVDLGHAYFNAISQERKEHINTAKAERLFSSVEQQIQYMDKIVSDLQDYARPLSPKREKVNVAAFIDETLSMLAVPEVVSVHVNVLPSITATMDRHLMQRALSNLITNAVQAMPKGGDLTIDAVTDDHTVVITVQDTGEGVAEDMKETLFSPLTTGKAKGTGLGLAVVKRIVEAHNGTITFESEEGKRTTFVVTLAQTAE